MLQLVPSEAHFLSSGTKATRSIEVEQYVVGKVSKRLLPLIFVLFAYLF